MQLLLCQNISNIRPKVLLAVGVTPAKLVAIKNAPSGTSEEGRLCMERRKKFAVDVQQFIQ